MTPRLISRTRVYVLASDRGLLHRDCRRMTGRTTHAVLFASHDGAAFALRNTRMPPGDWRIQAVDFDVEI